MIPPNRGPRARLPAHSSVTRRSASSSAELSWESLADVVERLFAAFEAQLDLPTIVAVARRCRRELEIASGPPRPEALERLARLRLSILVSRATA